MSITVIYSREKTDLLFSLTKHKFLLVGVFFGAFVMATIWLIQDHCQDQFDAFKVNAPLKKEAEKDTYLRSIKVHTEEKLQRLSKKISLLQDQLQHLNSRELGVVTKSYLSAKEFNFPWQIAIKSKSIGVDKSVFLSFQKKLEKFDIDFENKNNQLTLLSLVLNRYHIIDLLKNSVLGIKREESIARINDGYLSESHYVSENFSLVNSQGAYKKKAQVTDVASTGQTLEPLGHDDVLKTYKRINPNYYLRRNIHARTFDR